MPEWTADPSIEDITTLVRRELKIPTPDPCNNFDKAYTVTCGRGQEYILRLTVPVDARSKTMSEVATIEYIRHHTEVPVPQVFCYQASTANEVELEWILRARMPGRKLGDEWEGMDYFKKEQLVEEAKRRAQRLLDQMPKIFPEEDDEEVFVLPHQDLHAANIFVDSNDALTSISNWECTHTAPLWLACQLPSFLDLTDSTAAVFAYLNIEYSNEEYKTQVKLQQFFLEEMQRICPEWVEVHRASQLKVGFEQCVQHFGKAGDGKYIERWIDGVEREGSATLLKEIVRAEWVRDYVHGGYPFGSGLF
ncbi:hypothetical protein J4E81_008612 [Alternaria sp. BMP 2799]|nr:hypothetical protein J4E81_008612 [Alternaria sp. BMP 2799]